LIDARDLWSVGRNYGQIVDLAGGIKSKKPPILIPFPVLFMANIGINHKKEKRRILQKINIAVTAKYSSIALRLGNYAKSQTVSSSRRLLFSSRGTLLQALRNEIS
jgi:hypothetical protein